VSITPPSGLPSRQEITSSPCHPGVTMAFRALPTAAQTILLQPVSCKMILVIIHKATLSQLRPQQLPVTCTEAGLGEILLSLGQESCGSRHINTFTCKEYREPERAQNGAGE
jgi:hypothetical protein